MGLTLNDIKKHSPCEGSIEKFLAHHAECGMDTNITYKQIIESNGLDDALWVVNEIEDEKVSMELACTYAEHTLHIFEKYYPDDKAPRNCIETRRRFIRGEATREELDAASDAAWVSAWASDSASDAAWDSASALASVWGSASALASVWDIAPYAAPYSASASALASASASALASAREWQADKFLELIASLGGDAKFTTGEI